MSEFCEFGEMHCKGKWCEFVSLGKCTAKESGVSYVSFKTCIFLTPACEFQNKLTRNSHENSHTFPPDSGQMKNGMNPDSLGCELCELFSNPTYVRSEISKYARIYEIDHFLYTAAGNNSLKLTNSHTHLCGFFCANSNKVDVVGA